MKPTSIKPSRLDSVVKRHGFVEVTARRRGSHRFYRHADGRTTAISFHPGDVPTGTLKKIIEQIGMTIEAFNEEV